MIGEGGTLDLGAADAQNVAFNGIGTLKLEANSNFTGTISGLAGQLNGFPASIPMRQLQLGLKYTF